MGRPFGAFGALPSVAVGAPLRGCWAASPFPGFAVGGWLFGFQEGFKVSGSHGVVVSGFQGGFGFGSALDPTADFRRATAA